MHEALEGVKKGEFVRLKVRPGGGLSPQFRDHAHATVAGRFLHADSVGVHLEDREGDVARIRHEDVYDVHRPLRKS